MVLCNKEKKFDLKKTPQKNLEALVSALRERFQNLETQLKSGVGMSAYSYYSVRDYKSNFAWEIFHYIECNHLWHQTTPLLIIFL